MTALKVIGVIALVLVCVSLLRVGAIVEFGEALRVRLCIGPLRRTIVPGKKKAAPPPKQPAPAGEAAPQAANKRRLPKPTFSELRELSGTLLRALKKTLRKVCRRVRIDPLRVRVAFGGSDPADVAQTYGYACAALWSVMPALEELFCIPHPSIHLDTDFQSEKTSAEGTVGVSLRIGELIAIAVTLAFPLLKWFLRWRRAHRNDPAPETAEKGTAAPRETVDQTEQLSA